MAIRGLLWLALLFVIAVALATVGRFDTGQVLLVYPPYRVDVSLNLFVVALVVLFIVVYALLRIVRNIWRMPQRVAAYRARSRVAKAHAALRDAIGNLYAGRFSRAEKAARDALANGDNKGAAGLVAATAAHRMHEYARRDEWLAQIDEADWQDARLMATADMRADGRDADGALAALTEMQSQGGRRIHAQQIMLRAQQQLKNWSEVLKLVKRQFTRPWRCVYASLPLRTCCVTGVTTRMRCSNCGIRYRPPSGTRRVSPTSPRSCWWRSVAHTTRARSSRNRSRRTGTRACCAAIRTRPAAMPCR
jgi:uncharacterized membrane-anchored protein